MTAADRRRSTGAGLLAVGGAIVSFSLSTPIVKWSEETGVVLAFWRMWVASALWWIVLLGWRRVAHARGGIETAPALPDRNTWKMVLPAGLMFGINISLLFTAVTRTSIAAIEFIGALTPLIIVPAGALIFQERPNWSALKFGVISIGGIALVLFFGPATGTASLDGNLLMVVTLCSWSTYLIFTKRARLSGIDTPTFCLLYTSPSPRD